MYYINIQYCLAFLWQSFLTIFPCRFQFWNNLIIINKMGAEVLILSLGWWNFCFFTEHTSYVRIINGNITLGSLGNFIKSLRCIPMKWIARTFAVNWIEFFSVDFCGIHVTWLTWGYTTTHVWTNVVNFYPIPFQLVCHFPFLVTFACLTILKRQLKVLSLFFI